MSDRRFSDPNIYDNSIDWDDAPDGSDGGYTRHGNFICPDAMRELVVLRQKLASAHIDAASTVRIREKAEDVALDLGNPALWEPVARALMAERARCAKIVEADMEDVFRCYGPGEVTGVIRSRFEYIAAAIRHGDQ